ncbi:hypothetical protein QN367_15880 [Cryobacterium sp. RTS3]|uniref:hypothetical protein n=1 Tax=Cryobacterium sp. RTS3 TaxID=3048643 RepID=UPI002B22E094|nr:hypothetical protein [Cryobacterium sp. RTS3]MEB0000562.1 hypothetical protein [Cryobacterium sp. RTS3]
MYVVTGTRPVWWARASVQVGRIGIIAVGAALPWVSFVYWLGEPDRVLLGSTGRLFIIVTAVVQLFSVVAGIAVAGLLSTWTDHRGRQAARLWGWLALVPGVLLAGIVTVLWQGWPRESGPPLIVFGVICAVMVLTALISSRRSGLVTVIGSVLSLGIVALILIFATSMPGSVVLLGPATAYCVAVSLSASAAAYARI